MSFIRHWPAKDLFSKLTFLFSHLLEGTLVSSIPVMEYRSALAAQVQQTINTTEPRKMSTLTMPIPHHHTGFHREFSWQEARPTDYSRPRHEPEKIALPSIRQVGIFLCRTLRSKANDPAGLSRTEREDRAGQLCQNSFCHLADIWADGSIDSPRVYSHIRTE